MNTPRLKTSRRASQRGASLVEILVSLLILSVGLLGMSALQARALKGSISSFQRSQAVVLSQYLMDVMRVDRESAKGGSYNTPLTCNPDGISGSTLANNTLRDWLGSVKGNIGTPSDLTTCVVVTCDADYVCGVQILWDDSRAGGLSSQKIEVNSRV